MLAVGSRRARGLRLERIKRWRPLIRALPRFRLQVFAQFVLLFKETAALEVVGKNLHLSIHAQYSAWLQEQLMLYVSNVIEQDFSPRRCIQAKLGYTSQFDGRILL
jgi:hypothetical protein